MRGLARPAGPLELAQEVVGRGVVAHLAGPRAQPAIERSADAPPVGEEGGVDLGGRRGHGSSIRRAARRASYAASAAASAASASASRARAVSTLAWAASIAVARS